MSRRVNEFGALQWYDVGDQVRLWKVHKKPIGTIESIEDGECAPIKYRVSYVYPDNGTRYLETFESTDLTLYERKYNTYMCNCGTNTDRHSRWCNRYTPPGGSPWRS